MKQKLATGMSVVALLSSILLPVLRPMPVEAVGGYHLASWAKSPTTAILDVGDAGSWDEKGVGSAAVILDNGTYKMWYTGFDNDDVLQIGYATSANGTDWTKQGGTGGPVLPPGGLGDWDEKGVGSPTVIKAGDNEYVMWYTGYKEVDGESIPQIGIAISPDGIAWFKQPQVNPVLPSGGPGDWDEKGVHSPSVVKDGSTYKMWYTTRKGAPILGISGIAYATSADGASWTKYNGGTPVITSTEGTWDERGASVASVVKHGDSYYMWYTGYSGFNVDVNIKIGAAVSSDGISWTKNSNVVMSEEATGWNSGGVGSPRVLVEGSGATTQLRMWYSGLDSQFRSRIGLATLPLATITITAKLQGGNRPEDGMYVPFMVKLFDSSVTLTSQNILTATPLAAFTTSDWVGDVGGLSISGVDYASRTVTINATGVAPGSYQMSLVTEHTLVNLKQNVIVAESDISVNMGTLLEGNANNSNRTDITDFGILAAAYLATAASPNWDARADFDRNGQVTILDFSLLALNFNRSSPVAVTD